MTILIAAITVLYITFFFSLKQDGNSTDIDINLESTLDKQTSENKLAISEKSEKNNSQDVNSTLLYLNIFSYTLIV